MLGWVEPGQMVPEFDAAVFAAETGQPVGPVRTQFGVHVLLVEQREPGRPLEDGEWRERLRRALGAKQLTAHVQERIATLRRTARIELQGGMGP